MKAYNHLYESLDKFKDYLDSIELDRSRRVLVRIHTNVNTPGEIQLLAQDIKALLPNAVLIGCSTSHVICEGQILSGCLISITEFEDCEMKMGVFSCVTEAGKEKDGEVLCKEVIEGLVQGASGLMLVFFPLAYHKTAKFVEHMNRVGQGLKMIGGAAYVGEEGEPNGYPSDENRNMAFVLADTEVSITNMAVVLISSPHLSIYENAICGVENVGRSYEVTRVHDHYLDEIEGMDAATWYEEQIGKEELENDPLLVGIFPLVAETTQNAYNVVYEPYHTISGPYKLERRSRISMFTEVSAGSRFALGYFDPAKIVDQLNQVYHDMRQEPIEVVFAYECLSREWMLHDCAKWEVGQFYTTNMSGAMLGGEISNVNGKNIYANSTFVVAGISEDKDARILLKGNGLMNVSALQHNNVQMINYLLKAGNRQLSEQLSEQQNKMQKAMFYHEALGLDNQTRYLFERDNLKLDKIAVFSLKNARLIKLFMGQTAFYEEVKKIYGDIRKRFSDSRLHYYSYEECSLLLAAEEGMEDDDFIPQIKGIFDSLNGLSHKEFVFSYACAVVMHEEDPLQKVETTLQYCANNRIQSMLHSNIPKEVLNVKEEMHILQILRDAMVQDRVVPYFQGIYDNRKKKIDMYEALIRIQDGQGNIYYPDQFLPIAKEYNLYESLSIIMVRKVMEMFLDKEIKVTINLSVQDIYDRDMLKMIFDHLEKAAHPENFVFELVESEGVRDYQFIKQFADSIHEYGAKVSIDDFGSGFSNLLHIIRIDADILKIDGAIVREICHDMKSMEFVELINEWCLRQGKEVVGEFVENQNIQDMIEEIGVTYSQGYFFAKPQPWEMCEEIQSRGEQA
ncbi:MAG: EAL domain-containing protein [Lachnospiraceae bacterium]